MKPRSLVVMVVATSTVLLAPCGADSAAAWEGSTAAPAVQRTDDRCELTETPSACVFVISPFFAAEGDEVDASDANQYLVPMPLLGLDPDADGYLVGEYVDVGPEVNDPRTLSRETDGRFGAGRGDRGFEAQSAYVWIDYAQREVQRLGFSDLRADPTPVIALDQTNLDGAYYSPVERAIYMGGGVSGGGISESEDADGLLHEYGHVLLDDVQPGLLGGDTGAYHEAFGTIFAYLVSLEYRLGDAECVFHWADQGCTQRMDVERVYPDDLVQQVHQDGLIYSSAIFDIFVALLTEEDIDVDDCPGSDVCNDVRDRLLTTVLASNYYIVAGMSLPDIADAFLLANDAQFDGAGADVMSSVFAEHGLDGGTGAILVPGAETSPDSSSATIEVAIDHTFRGDLFVEVGVRDGAGEPLCDPVIVHSARQRGRRRQPHRSGRCERHRLRRLPSTLAGPRVVSPRPRRPRRGRRPGGVVRGVRRRRPVPGPGTAAADRRC